MKTLTYIFLLLISVGCLTLTSCQKDTFTYEECYSIPNSKVLAIDTTTDLLNKVVNVQWHSSDGRGEYFTTKVKQISNMGKGAFLININGSGSGSTYIQDNDSIYISLLVWQNKVTKIYTAEAFKPSIRGEHMIWNPMNYAPIGVTETNNTIIISSNGLMSQTSDATMCMQIIIQK